MPTDASYQSVFEYAVRVQLAAPSGQDRAGCFAFRGGYLFVIADGAGGTGGGAEAAREIVDAFRDLDTDSQDWPEVLKALDRRMAGNPSSGEAAAVVAFGHGRTVVGASVGDSEAWLVSQHGVVDLTNRQRRKPLLGSGCSVPVSFGPVALRGRLLLGSDGLFKYADITTICELAMRSPIEVAAAALIDASRLPSGSLQDDVTVIVAGSRTDQESTGDR